MGFVRVTKNVKRGRNKALKQLQVIDENINRIKTHHERHEMENRTINHNKKHFKKAHSSKIHNNQICELLLNNSIRDNIFNGALNENNCGDEDVRKF